MGRRATVRHPDRVPTDVVSEATRRLVAAFVAGRAWVPSALLATIVAVVELVRGGALPWVALLAGWAIFAVGLIAAGTAGGRSIADGWRRFLLLSVAGGWAVLVAGFGTGDPDVLFITGVAVFIVGVESAEHMGDRFRDAIQALFDRGVLRLSETEQVAYWARLARTAGRWQAVTGAVVGVVMFAGWLVAFRHNLPVLLTRRLAAVVFETLAAVVAGQRLGRMFGYGSGWRLLRISRDNLTLVPGHPDGAAGLNPMGGFYFRQSLVASLPGAYLAVWWFLIPAWPRYAVWRPVYLWLLPLAIAFEVLAFLVPMRRIHEAMAVQRRAFITEADRLTPLIAASQAAQAEQAAVPGGSDEASKRLVVLLERYKTLRQVPSWPVARSLRRWFGLNNVALVLPFLGYVVGNVDFWDKVGKALGGLQH